MPAAQKLDGSEPLFVLLFTKCLEVEFAEVRLQDFA
jgi:hypothetical protein